MHWAGLLRLIFSRYFNAWVESGHLHIQTEFCEGGSLEAKAGLDPYYYQYITCQLGSQTAISDRT